MEFRNNIETRHKELTPRLKMLSNEKSEEELQNYIDKMKKLIPLYYLNNKSTVEMSVKEEFIRVGKLFHFNDEKDKAGTR